MQCHRKKNFTQPFNTTTKVGFNDGSKGLLTIVREPSLSQGLWRPKSVTDFPYF